MSNNRPLAAENHHQRPEVTPEDVRNVAFDKASHGRRGYHAGEVDEFLGRVEAALRNPTETSALTPAHIEHVAFSKPPPGQRGYDEDQVDAFLDLVKIKLSGQVESRGHSWRVERNTIKVVDPTGVRWSVHRQWGVRYWDGWQDDGSADAMDVADMVVLLQLIVLWPLWFLGKCLGVRFKIVIIRNGDKAGEVKVRGWSRSRRRLREIAAIAAAGTLQQELDADPQLSNPTAPQ